MFDVIVVGGSYAGMAAALQLARARRSVAVIDAGVRRNRFASAAHGLLGLDGVAPSTIWSDAKDQLLAYPNVTWRAAEVSTAEKTRRHFAVSTSDAETLHGSRLVLATGVQDHLPEIPGLPERWGKLVFHCPYCHGYELNQGSLGVLATGEMSMHQALLIPEWGATTLFTSGNFEPDDEQRAQLGKRGVMIEPEVVTSISGEGNAVIHLRDGRSIELAGLFVASRVDASGRLTEQLECTLAETPLGTIIETNDFKETSVSGLYACGDAARAAGNITSAISDGMMAGIATHRSLIFDGLG